MTRADELDTIAAQWIVRREKGEWSTADQSEFDNWLAAAPGNRIAYLRLTDVWNRAGRLKALDQPARRGFFATRCRGDVGDVRQRITAMGTPPISPRFHRQAPDARGRRKSWLRDGSPRRAVTPPA